MFLVQGAVLLAGASALTTARSLQSVGRTVTVPRASVCAELRDRSWLLGTREVGTCHVMEDGLCYVADEVPRHGLSTAQGGYPVGRMGSQQNNAGLRAVERQRQQRGMPPQQGWLQEQGIGTAPMQGRVMPTAGGQAPPRQAAPSSRGSVPMRAPPGGGGFGAPQAALARPGAPVGGFGAPQAVPARSGAPAGGFGAPQAAPARSGAPAGGFGAAPARPGAPAGGFGAPQAVPARPGAPTGGFGAPQGAPARPGVPSAGGGGDAQTLAAQAGVSVEKATEALDACDGDVSDAAMWLKFQS